VQDVDRHGIVGPQQHVGIVGNRVVAVDLLARVIGTQALMGAVVLDVEPADERVGKVRRQAGPFGEELADVGGDRLRGGA
jgi:hypothetical protein